MLSHGLGWKLWSILGLLWVVGVTLTVRVTELPPTGFVRDHIFISALAIAIASALFGAITLCAMCVIRIAKPTLWRGYGLYRISGVDKSTLNESIIEVRAESRKAARMKADLSGLAPTTVRCVRVGPDDGVNQANWLSQFLKYSWITVSFAAVLVLLTAPWSEQMRRAHKAAFMVQSEFKWESNPYSAEREDDLTDALRRSLRGAELWRVSFVHTSLIGASIERLRQNDIASQSTGANFNPYSALNDETGEKLDRALYDYPALRVDLLTSSLDSVQSEPGLHAYLDRRTRFMIDRCRFDELPKSKTMVVSIICQLPDVLLAIAVMAVIAFGFKKTAAETPTAGE